MPRTYRAIGYYDKNNRLHRKDGPAIIWPNGTKYWYLDGKYYGNSDKPPVEYLAALKKL